jgi:hypothetical protein
VKQPLKVFILLIFVSLTLAQCRDRAVEIDPHFVGVWNGTDGISTYVLSINNSSNGFWHCNNHGVFETAQGVARIKHGKLCVGLKNFDINQYPAQDTAGTWTTILSGITYTKQ